MTNEELVALIQSGERDRLPELWARVERFVALSARRRLILSGGLGGVTFDDLYDSGYLALAAAVDSYDPGQGMAFIGWLSTHLKTAFAEAGGYRSKKQAQDPIHWAGSLDTPLGDDEDGDTLGDLQADPDSAQGFEEVEARAWREQAHAALERALDTLPEQQADTLRARYYEGKPFRRISEEGGISIEEVRKRESKGLRALRQPKISRELRQCIEERTPYYSGVGLSSFQRGGSQPERLTILREKWEKGYP